MKVAIIGAGVSGLASARNSVQNNVDCVVFEATDTVGGTWAYTDEVITDEHDVPIHASIYKSLRVNLPTQLTEFNGYEFVPKSGLCYPGHEEVYEYIKKFSQEFDLYPLIKFQHLVQCISKDDINGWKITVKNLKNNEISCQYFDAVMICSGINAKYEMPNIPGLENFEGTKIHSGTYRGNFPYQNKNVLIIGQGPSALDICLECAEVADKVYISHRKAYKPPIFHEKVDIKPAVSTISSNTVTFTDETTVRIDSIILCTGYEFHLPFLDKSCGVNVEEKHIIRPLYKLLFNINHPTMGFIGFVKETLFFPLVDLQARVFLKYLIGLIDLPPTKSMLQWELEEHEKNVREKVPAAKYHSIMEEMRRYFDDLVDLGQTETISEARFKIFFRNLETWINNYGNVKKQKFQLIDNESFSWELTSNQTQNNPSSLSSSKDKF